MAEIINLRRVRKGKVREEKTNQAAENRVKFGRTKGQKRVTETERGRNTRSLDGRKLD